ncbi:hypothetical protein [Paenibacillus lemnae]|uniref:Uncharacterized protein n=1 Tax=Paenibacillus lemnae TaxID=1330551 RepID=A0A848MAM0_PAELE|nr:hypothetical protein [Paenibacillus lemnae]NMO97715.1 hypothetical protein [Paenibacillus lemnae]
MPEGDYIQRQEKRGSRILESLIVVNILGFTIILLLSFINGMFFNMISLIIMIVLSMLIYYGGNIAKWVYITVNILNIFSMLYVLTAGIITSNATLFPILLNTVTMLMQVISLVTSIVLIFSGSVKEFMYKQKN